MEAFIAISGDFKHVTLDSTLAAFHQFVDGPTTYKGTTDLLYEGHIQGHSPPY